jgi:hypothetical protein
MRKRDKIGAEKPQAWMRDTRSYGRRTEITPLRPFQRIKYPGWPASYSRKTAVNWVLFFLE